MPWAPTPLPLTPPPFPKMLNPPGQWSHWCWQDVMMRAEELGAALSSALTSPSGVSWAFGQLGAFPGELELSLKPWPKSMNKQGGSRNTENQPGQTSQCFYNSTLLVHTFFRAPIFLSFQCWTTWIVSLSAPPMVDSLPTWYPLWPQIPLDWEHQQGLVSDAWLLAVSLNESLKPEAFHWQRRGPLAL